MSIDMDALGEDFEEHKKNEEERKKSSKFANNYRPHEGSQNACFLCPPHKVMEGKPYQMRGSHFGCGPTNDKIITCRRDRRNVPVDECPQCVDVSKLFASKQQSKIDVGKKRARKQQYIWGCLDMRNFVDKDGAPVEILAPPKCFGNYVGEEKAQGYKRCQKCIETVGSWGVTCQMGVCAFRQGAMLYEPTYKAIKRFHTKGVDITNPSDGLMMVTEQKNKDKSGREKYSILSWEPIKLPKIVKKWMEENLLELDKIFPPKSKEEIKAIMQGVEYEASDADSDLPTCFGDPKVFDKGSDECQGCEAFTLCAADIEGEPDAETPAEPDEPASDEASEIDLNSLNRKELKQLINEDDELKITVYKGMTDDDIRNAIFAEKGGKEPEPEEEEPEPEPEEPEPDEPEEPEEPSNDADEETGLEKMLRERNEKKGAKTGKRVVKV